MEDDALPSLELAPLLLLGEGLGEGLSLGELLVLVLEPGEGESELMLPPLGGAPASAPDEELPLPLAPDAPEELSPVELEPALPLLAPALAPPPLASPLAPPPCAQAAVAKATMAAVTAALMTLRFIFNSSRVGMEMWTAPDKNARTMPWFGKVRVSFWGILRRERRGPCRQRC